jgi:ATP-dependent protease ClpP protease subunit
MSSIRVSSDMLRASTDSNDSSGGSDINDSIGDTDPMLRESTNDATHSLQPVCSRLMQFVHSVMPVSHTVQPADPIDEPCNISDCSFGPASKSKTLYFSGSITTADINALVNMIIQLVANDVKKIRIVISSPGGNPLAVGLLSSMLETQRSLNESFPMIETVGAGIGSAAVMLWLCGDRRMILSGTSFMIHGQITHVGSERTNTTRQFDKAANLHSAKALSRFTRGYTVDEWMELFENGMDNFIDVDEAGFADII